MSAFASMETLEQFATRTGVPREEGSEDAAEWVATRLSPKQREALAGFPAPYKHFFAVEIGASGTTLYSLLDFARHKRDCLAPLMLVTREYEVFDHAYTWSMTQFGLKVLSVASGMSAFGQDAEERLEAKPASPAPKGDAHA